MGVRERKEREKRALRERILDAAAELFAEHGYEDVSMRGIAERIEYSPTTLYLYFEDKDELLRTIAERSLFRLLATVETIRWETGDPLAALRRCGRAYVEYGLAHPNEYKLVFVTTPPRKRGAQGGLEEGSAGEKVYRFLCSLVAECIARSRFRHADVETTSQVLWAAVHGITSLSIAHDEFPWADRDRVIDQLIDSVVEGPRGRGLQA